MLHAIQRAFGRGKPAPLQNSSYLINTDTLTGITGGASSFSHRFGEVCIERGLITPEMLRVALLEQSITKKKIGNTLVEQGFITEKDRIKILLETSYDGVSEEAVIQSRIDPATLEEEGIYLASEDHDTLYISTDRDEDAVREIVQPAYRDKKLKFLNFEASAMHDFVDGLRRRARITGGSEPGQIDLDNLLSEALVRFASDIHFHPKRESTSIFYRLFGHRKLKYEITLPEYASLVSKIKSRAGMDTFNTLKPADGGFSFEYNQRLITVRVSTLPNVNGEMVILRILDPDRVQPKLDNLGITQVGRWRRAVRQRSGILLVCGPTGAGKTTTMAATFKELDRLGKHVCSVEDPPEYILPFVDQIPINLLVGLDFAKASRQLLRSDPDIVLIGEIRDAEVAQNAINLAETGHLIMATLHCESIPSVMGRMRELDVDPRKMRRLLRAVLIQNVIRTICPSCGGEGCDKCTETGYFGQTAVSEFKEFSSPHEVDEIIDGREKRDWTTMAEDAIAKAHSGVTDMDEVKLHFGFELEQYGIQIE
ncbi:GspE/PulE family protein [Pseudovibrio ascidiaceicola]|uniref:GspE/PulE family protein n=1 Tax=Pseudovibrio ascidiaceicola TaxID=285279 RepID=UPI003D36A924